MADALTEALTGQPAAYDPRREPETPTTPGSEFEQAFPDPAPALVAVEQAQVCVPERRLRKTFSLLLALVGAATLVGTGPWRRPFSEAASVEVDEARRRAAVV